MLFAHEVIKDGSELSMSKRVSFCSPRQAGGGVRAVEIASWASQWQGARLPRLVRMKVVGSILTLAPVVCLEFCTFSRSSGFPLHI